jgi:hypothetical protein
LNELGQRRGHQIHRAPDTIPSKDDLRVEPFSSAISFSEILLEYPTQAHPFIFYHVAKTGGSSLRTMLLNSLDSNVIHYIPCYSVQCDCQFHYFRPNISESCDLARLRRASVVAGHFSPPNLADLRDTSKARCVVIARDPVARVVSHYSFFDDVHVIFGNKSFEQLGVSEKYEVLNLVGGGDYMTKYLACASGLICRNESVTLVETALFNIRNCLVGTVEEYSLLLLHLRILLPWFHYSDQIHEKRTKSTPPSAITVRTLRNLTTTDHMLHAAISGKVKSQSAKIILCFKATHSYHSAWNVALPDVLHAVTRNSASRKALLRCVWN